MKSKKPKMTLEKMRKQVDTMAEKHDLTPKDIDFLTDWIIAEGEEINRSDDTLQLRWLSQQGAEGKNKKIGKRE